ncbi:MAG: UDP-N-acetylmuramoyl-L-alanyl-D-glutamate--2,6-diaminopimelate ligase [Methylomonas sp.]
MKLSELLKGLVEVETDVDVNGLTLDSRKVNPGDAFIALHGASQHGIAHARQAIASGAITVIYDLTGLDREPSQVRDAVSVAVPELSRQLGAIAAKFYGHPSRQLAVIGITGTNGKTTCSQLIAQALSDCGVIGTLGWGEPGQLTPTLNTTPDALAIQGMLQQFVRRQKRAVAMEVSSHGLQQGRVNAVEFTGAVFTNLSRDHLDYHGDMDSYLQAKLALFRNPALKFAVINLDDPSSTAVQRSLAAGVQRWTFSAKGEKAFGAENIVAENVRYGAEGIHFDVVWGERKANAFTPIAGAFNLENVLAVLGVLLAMGISFPEAVARLANLKAIVGRMEKFGGQGKPTVFVDYAHTPDALEKVLKAVKGGGQLWVVFGCGGNRDKGKRPEMGRIAKTWADRVIITDDNPRSEPSTAIINDILAGCQSSASTNAGESVKQESQTVSAASATSAIVEKITVINDRATAIRTAIEQADKQDCVMIAGKGHEDYQEISGVKMPFSDQDFVKQALAVRGE